MHVKNAHHYHTWSHEKLCEQFNSSLNGLTTKQADKNMTKFGLNTVPEKKRESVIKIYFRDHLNTMFNYICFIAVALVAMKSIALKSIEIDEISFIVTLSAIIFITSIMTCVVDLKRSELTEQLKKLTGKKATVIRDGQRTEIEVEQIVPGDIIIMVAGDSCAADMVVFDTKGGPKVFERFNS